MDGPISLVEQELLSEAVSGATLCRASAGYRLPDFTQAEIDAAIQSLVEKGLLSRMSSRQGDFFCFKLANPAKRLFKMATRPARKS
jgi:hypothetical protein